MKTLPPRHRNNALEKVSTSATSGRNARWMNRNGRASKTQSRFGFIRNSIFGSKSKNA